MAGSTWTQGDFRFSVAFEPAFLPGSRVVMERRGETATLSIKFALDERLRKLKEDAACLEHIERVPVGGKDYAKFLRELDPFCPDEQRNLVKGMLDGISIHFRVQAGTTDHSFVWECPDRTDIGQFRLIEALFDFFESSFKTPETVGYLERLKGYFDFGLLVKKTSEHPLEYRLYSHLTANEAEEFWLFLRSLPRDRPVVFDLTNFQVMGTMFYESIRGFIIENPDVFWLVDGVTAGLAAAIGVYPDKIIRNRCDLPARLKAS